MSTKINARAVFTPKLLLLAARMRKAGLTSGTGHTMTRQRVRNIVVVVRTTVLFGVAEGWSLDKIKRACHIAVECILAESGALRYANRWNKASLRAYHEDVGQDHDSVGLQQQRVPMWGTTDECMDPATSTRKFLRRLRNVDWNGRTNWQIVQAIQVSAISDGSNYKAHDQAAIRLVGAVFTYALAPRSVQRQLPASMRSK